METEHTRLLARIDNLERRISALEGRYAAPPAPDHTQAPPRAHVAPPAPAPDQYGVPGTHTAGSPTREPQSYEGAL